MAGVLLHSAIFVSLLLTMSPTGAGADGVTWRKCKGKYTIERALEASSDNKATWLYLTYCNLTEIRSGDFYGLPNVIGMNLFHNHIAHVDLAAFSDVPKLRKLVLAENNLREAPVFDEHSFCPSLIELFLEKNKITELKNPRTFSGCVELQEIDLSQNVIKYINPDVFKPLRKLEKLSMHYNRLTIIPESLLLHNVKLGFLSLYKNNIPFLASDFVTKLRTAGAPLKEFYFYENPWHCACLLELLADAKGAGVRYIYWYPNEYGGRQPLCLHSGPFPCSRPSPSGLLRRAGKHPLAGGNAAP